MYARRLRCRCQKWDPLLQYSASLFRYIRCEVSETCSHSKSTHYRRKLLGDSFTRKFGSTPFSLTGDSDNGLAKIDGARFLYSSCRYYSSDSNGNNASDGKHVPAKGSTTFAKGTRDKEKVVSVSKHSNDHAWFGEQDQHEWLELEKLSIDSKRKESPFLTKRQKFKNEFLRRVVPWEKIKVSWNNFPYHIHEHTRNTLVECASAHLKHKNMASSYGSRLASSSGRILLQGAPGTELYRERVVRALARELHVNLLVLDSNVLAPYDFGQEYNTECESDDENVESGEECTSESEVDDNDSSNQEEWASSNETKSSESGEDENEQSSVEALKKFVPCSLEEFSKRVSGEVDAPSTSMEPDSTSSTEQSKKPLRKGDRVKYNGASVQIEVDNRPLSTGQRGEVYEVKGDQVAVILDNAESKSEDENKSKESTTEQDTKPSIYWIDVQDLVHDLDTRAEDWFMSLEALCETLPALGPTILYFPDCNRWLSKAVPKSNRKVFIAKVEEMFDQLPCATVLICGENITEIGSKEKEKLTMVLPGLGRLAQLPLPLKRLTESLGGGKSSKDKDMSKLFTNSICIHAPEEEDHLRIFNKQIEEDRKIIISRNNLIELHKVIGEHELSCTNLLEVKTDGVILTKQDAGKVVGWARNHYLSSTLLPSVKGDRLIIPSESLEIALARLKEEETIFRKPSQTLKPATKDEYEKAFLHALVPAEDVGVRFDDIGALEDVKRTLNELVSLPMKRPELFSRGNLLRPCKGILLFGPPGTGKTLLAKALATESGANFLSISSSSLTSKWFGDAEKLTRALFSFASRLTPVIIFIDEVDSLLGARGGALEHEATRRLRNEFMAAWDGLKSKDSQRILILGATNRPFDLDDAVIRRLPRRIYVDLPNAENRMKILKVLLSQENLEPNFKFDELANVTEGYSGSDLKNLCIAAAYTPVQELLSEEAKGYQGESTPSLRSLKLDDFVKAKSKVSASVAYDATSMNALREWNARYGEGGSRRQSPFGFGR